MNEPKKRIYPPRELVKLSMSEIERFWERVHKKRADECWLWIGKSFPCGYGNLYLRGNAYGAHRVSWTINVGNIPDGLWVLHKCDQFYPVGDITYRRCVNPAHLFLGTQSDNMKDCSKKGRMNSARGSRVTISKLDESKVIQMRKRRDSGEVLRTIASDFGVSIHTAWQVVTRQTWGHVK